MPCLVKPPLLISTMPQETRDPMRDFLNEMEVVMPWSALLSASNPITQRMGNGRRGRQPMPLESMRRFAGFNGVTEVLPDETTTLPILNTLVQIKGVFKA